MGGKWPYNTVSWGVAVRICSKQYVALCSSNLAFSPGGIVRVVHP